MENARRDRAGGRGREPVSGQRVAVVGGGAAGLITAWLLRHDHQVTLYEREPHAGGHAHSVLVPCQGVTVPAEAGFKYFLDGSHTRVLALMRLLGLAPERRRSSMTIEDRIHGVRLVLPPRSPRHLGRLLTQPRALRHVLAFRRYLGSAGRVVAARDWSLTIGAHAASLGLPERFIDEFLLPLCASSWGAPLEEMVNFPAYDLLKNLWKGAAGFYELPGGISSYVDALVAELEGVELRLHQPVTRLWPAGARIGLEAGGLRQEYDQVVLATPPWIAADLLAGLPAGAELAAALRQFRWFDTGIFIHGDPTFMPPDRADWSVINHRFEPGYLRMTEWSGHHLRRPVFRSWVRPGMPEPSQVHARFAYRHLIVTPEQPSWQARLERLQGQHRTQHGIWLAGMYATDVDDHESALLSAVRVAEALAPGSPSLRRLRDATAATGGLSAVG
jgi:uncharacterized protein